MFSLHNMTYMCRECGKTFRSQANLRRHADQHRGIYPYKCQLCGKGSTNRVYLKEHMSTEHNFEDSFSCDKCDETFATRWRLKKHGIMCVGKRRERKMQHDGDFMCVMPTGKELEDVMCGIPPGKEPVDMCGMPEEKGHGDVMCVTHEE